MHEPIAFIGVGRMGSRMSKRLLDAGYARHRLRPERRGHRRARRRAARRAASSPADAVAGAAFILCSLPNPAILREAIAGSGGVLEGADRAR